MDIMSFHELSFNHMTTEVRAKGLNAKYVVTMEIQVFRLTYNLLIQLYMNVV